MWPENWRALQVFVAMGTQWRVAGGMRLLYLGLDYSTLPIVEARLADAPGATHPEPAKLLAQLRSMEIAALDVLNRQNT